MKNHTIAQHELAKLLGKRLTGVIIHGSHGEILEMQFEDNQIVYVCSTHGIDDKSVKDDPNDIYVSINEKAL